MTDVSSERVGDILLGASYRPEEGDTKGGFTGVFATIAKSYFQKYGDKSDYFSKNCCKKSRKWMCKSHLHICKKN